MYTHTHTQSPTLFRMCCWKRSRAQQFCPQFKTTCNICTMPSHAWRASWHHILPARLDTLLLGLRLRKGLLLLLAVLPRVREQVCNLTGGQLHTRIHPCPTLPGADLRLSAGGVSRSLGGKGRAVQEGLQASMTVEERCSAAKMSMCRVSV